MSDKPTEHRLIEGGGHWLPFAQNEARRLRTSGLIHVSKRLLMPDGASVFVRVEPGHDHIHIKLTGGEMPMDSGVVDVWNIAPAHADAFRAGTLMETAYVATYHAPFTLRDGDPPRLKDRNGVNDGQFAGILKAQGKVFTGQVPVDREDAKSFRPVTGETQDSVLYEKKRCAVLCPASMFTGKLRLYVQALYGAHLSAKAGSGHTIPFELVEGQSRPALRLNNRFKGPTGSTVDHRVLLSTGNGLHLDKTTGKHWLFSFTAGMRAYKMKAPAHVEALRGWLIHPVNDRHPDRDHPLSEEDREHLEAYILSQCLPYADTTIMPNPWCTPESGAVADPWCMGYSWHWNWSGTAAIARVNEVYEQDLTNSAMETRTYEVEVTKVGEDLFSVLQLHSNAPVRWSVYRTLWTITEPDWASGTQVKMTPKHSQVFASTATFYSYYERDTLMNCIVTVASENAQPASVTFTNGATGGPDGSNCFTVGTNEGARIQTGGVGSQLSARFNIGPYVTRSLSSGWSQARWTLEVRNKVTGAWGTGYFLYSYEHTAGPWSFSVSNDDGSNAHIEVNTNYLYVDRATKSFTSDTVSTVGREEEYGQATIVVPMYDAQAVYVQTSIANTKTVDTQTNYHLGSGGGFGNGWLVRSGVAVSHSDPTDAYIYFSYAQSKGANVADGHALLSTTYEVDPPILTGSNEEKLICPAGQLDAAFENLGAFHDNAEENVTSGFATLASTKRRPNGVALSNYLVDNEGLGEASANVPVLVGWV